jgi:hypothetical protein
MYAFILKGDGYYAVVPSELYSKKEKELLANDKKYLFESNYFDVAGDFLEEHISDKVFIYGFHTRSTLPQQATDYLARENYNW